MTETEEQSTDSNEDRNPTSELLPSRRHNMTMEISIFFIMLSSSLTGIAISNIKLYRTCVYSLDHSESECRFFLSPEKNNGSQLLEKQVQKYLTFLNTVQIIIESLVPAILTLVLGVWSDRYGRKPVIVWPLFGIAMTGILVVIYSMLDTLGPWWYLLTVIPYSLTGGFTVIFTGAFCYISEVSTTEKRSLRMTILEAFVSAGSVLGSLLSPHILGAVGNVYLLLISASLNVFVYAFTVIFLRESLTGVVQPQGGICTVFDFQLVKEMVRECFKRRPNYGRAQILLLTFANSLTMFVLYGLFDLEYMYTREKLQFALKDFTLYSAINTTISFFGSLLGVLILQRFLKISDLMFVHVAFLSRITEFVIIALAVTTWHIYFAAVVSMFRTLSSPLIRSQITKILPLEDTGKVFALMSAIKGICLLVSPPIYNSLYRFTLTSFPASIYVLSCGFGGICIIFVGFAQFYRRNASRPYSQLEADLITE